MRIRHGGMSIDVPGHWRDHSTLLFVGLPEENTTVGARRVEVPAEAVTVNLVEEKGDDPRAFLREEADSLANLDEAFTVLGEGVIQAELGQGWQQLRRITVGGEVVQQISVAFALPEMMLQATASVKESAFHSREKVLLEVLRSLRLEDAD